ncbi:hypothetical protein [Desulfobacca acetoxidans]
MSMNIEKKRVLQVILDKGMVRGGELMLEAGLNPKDLVKEVQELVDDNIVFKTGKIDEKNIFSARFQVLPGDRASVKNLLK